MTAIQFLTTIALSLMSNVAQAQADCPKAGELKNFAHYVTDRNI
jgi:hypothetical protein